MPARIGKPARLRVDNSQMAIPTKSTAPNVIEFFLAQALNLRTIRFGSSTWLDDATLERVIAQGGLRRAREIRIPQTYELTMRSVQRMLDSCSELSVLAGIEGWAGVSEQELGLLRNSVRAENYDLVI